MTDTWWKDLSLRATVKEFMDILDVVETSDEGRMFHPTTVGTCRSMEQEKIGRLLKAMRELTRD